MIPGRLRVLFLPLAAALIFVAVEYRLRQPESTGPVRGTDSLVRRRPPPALEGTDSANRYFRLDRYLGRQEVLVVFFDRATGANGNPVLAELKKQTQMLRKRGIAVVAVSSALPQENRQAGFETPVPFVLVTDPDQVWKYHRQWGRLDLDTGTATPGVFYVDRKGHVETDRRQPVAVEEPLSLIQQLLNP